MWRIWLAAGWAAPGTTLSCAFEPRWTSHRSNNEALNAYDFTLVSSPSVSRDHRTQRERHDGSPQA